MFYEVGGREFKRTEAFYIGTKAGVRVKGAMSENFDDSSLWGGEGCVTSPWLFNVYTWMVVRGR